MKAIIVGHGRHGKDTVAEILAKEFGLTFQSSSWLAAEKVCRPWMAKLGIEYPTLEACYEDRHNHREEWYKAIVAYNSPDKASLCREIFQHSQLYVGMRDREEFIASQRLADLTIWIDATQRLDYVDPTCKVLKEDADIIIDNNGTRPQLMRRVVRLGEVLKL